MGILGLTRDIKQLTGIVELANFGELKAKLPEDIRALVVDGHNFCSGLTTGLNQLLDGDLFGFTINVIKTLTKLVDFTGLPTVVVMDGYTPPDVHKYVSDMRTCDSLENRAPKSVFSVLNGEQSLAGRPLSALTHNAFYEAVNRIAENSQVPVALYVPDGKADPVCAWAAAGHWPEFFRDEHGALPAGVADVAGGAAVVTNDTDMTVHPHVPVVILTSPLHAASRQNGDAGGPRLRMIMRGRVGQLFGTQQCALATLLAAQLKGSDGTRGSVVQLGKHVLKQEPAITRAESIEDDATCIKPCAFVAQNLITENTVIGKVASGITEGFTQEMQKDGAGAGAAPDEGSEFTLSLDSLASRSFAEYAALKLIGVKSYGRYDDETPEEAAAAAATGETPARHYRPAGIADGDSNDLGELDAAAPLAKYAGKLEPSDARRLFYVVAARLHHALRAYVVQDDAQYQPMAPSCTDVPELSRAMREKYRLGRLGHLKSVLAGVHNGQYRVSSCVMLSRKAFLHAVWSTDKTLVDCFVDALYEAKLYGSAVSYETDDDVPKLLDRALSAFLDSWHKRLYDSAPEKCSCKSVLPVSESGKENLDFDFCLMMVVKLKKVMPRVVARLPGRLWMPAYFDLHQSLCQACWSSSGKKKMLFFSGISDGSAGRSTNVVSQDEVRERMRSAINAYIDAYSRRVCLRPLQLAKDERTINTVLDVVNNHRKVNDELCTKLASHPSLSRLYSSWIKDGQRRVGSLYERFCGVLDAEDLSGRVMNKYWAKCSADALFEALNSYISDCRRRLVGDDAPEQAQLPDDTRKCILACAERIKGARCDFAFCRKVVGELRAEENCCRVFDELSRAFELYDNGTHPFMLPPISRAGCLATGCITEHDSLSVRYFGLKYDEGRTFSKEFNLLLGKVRRPSGWVTGKVPFLSVAREVLGQDGVPAWLSNPDLTPAQRGLGLGLAMVAQCTDECPECVRDKLAALGSEKGSEEVFQKLCELMEGRRKEIVALIEDRSEPKKRSTELSITVSNFFIIDVVSNATATLARLLALTQAAVYPVCLISSADIVQAVLN